MCHRLNSGIGIRLRRQIRQTGTDLMSSEVRQAYWQPGERVRADECRRANTAEQRASCGFPQGCSLRSSWKASARGLVAERGVRPRRVVVTDPGLDRAGAL